MRDKIKLESSAGTVTSTQLLKTNVLCLANWKSKKFDPVARKHVIYKETKLK